MNSYEAGKDIFSGHHTFVTGATQQGKTHFMRRRVEQLKKTILFFNPQDEKMAGMIKAGASDDLGVIMAALKRGRKVNFIPSLDNSRAAVELAILIDGLFRSGWTKDHNMLLVVDECHLAKAHKEGERAVELVATRGLRFGVHAIFATQRPAYAHKAAFTQSDLHVIFRTQMEREYFAAKGIPNAEYERIIKDGGQYAYAVFNGLEMKGPFKE